MYFIRRDFVVVAKIEIKMLIDRVENRMFLFFILKFFREKYVNEAINRKINAIIANEILSGGYIAHDAMKIVIAIAPITSEEM